MKIRERFQHATAAPVLVVGWSRFWYLQDILHAVGLLGVGNTVSGPPRNGKGGRWTSAAMLPHARTFSPLRRPDTGKFQRSLFCHEEGRTGCSNRIGLPAGCGWQQLKSKAQNDLDLRGRSQERLGKDSMVKSQERLDKATTGTL
jgi:hypothetical protein